MVVCNGLMIQLDINHISNILPLKKVMVYQEEMVSFYLNGYV
jgi:hypothetical protein